MNKHKNIIIAGLVGCALCATATSCQKNEDGTIDLSGYTPQEEVTLVYNHPCALYSAADFERVRTAIANNSLNAAQLEEFNALKSNTYVNGDYGTVTHAHEQIVRGDAIGTKENRETAGDAMRDAAAAHQFGLLWQLTRDAQYAKKGIKILMDWAHTCKEVTANDNNYYLAAGAQGYTFALAGEELRDYEEWSESEFTEYKNWMKDVFGDKNYKFLQLHGSSNCGSHKHYMSNWDLVNLCSYLQIGILTEDDAIVQFVAD